MFERTCWLVAVWLVLIVEPQISLAGDWPMWRGNSGRQNYTSDDLPEKLELHWSRELPPPRSAWPAAYTKLQYDAMYEPIVYGQRMFVGSMNEDTLAAYSTRTGEQLWQFFVEGPVRFAPVAHQDKVYIGSDDGYLYCLAAETGKLLWKFNGGPKQQRLLGNGRLISAWPIRGGPVLEDSTIYFGCGCWSSMGVFVHALDATTGKPLWTNSTLGSKWTANADGTGSFGTVVPEGYLAVAGDYLIVPGGRSLPVILDRETGQLQHFRFGNEIDGGYAVTASQHCYAVNQQLFLTKDGERIELDYNFPLFNNAQMLMQHRNRLSALITKFSFRQALTRNEQGRFVKQFEFKPRSVWQSTLPSDVSGTPNLWAGSTLLCTAEDKICALSLPRFGARNQEIELLWEIENSADYRRFLFGDNRLFAVTPSGRIDCYGTANERPSPTVQEYAVMVEPLEESNDRLSNQYLDLATYVDILDGHALVLGIGTGRAVEELLTRTKLHVLVVDGDAEKVDRLRKRLQYAGVYGKRVTVFQGKPETFAFPPYLATLITSDQPSILPALLEPKHLTQLYSALHPYGGVAAFVLDGDAVSAFASAVENEQLPNAKVSGAGTWTFLFREGALPNTGTYTHRAGNAANTGSSIDGRLKAPLGPLWFGGDHQGLPLQGQGPNPQSSGGRVIVEDGHILRASDLYTGRLLWEREFVGFSARYAESDGDYETGSNYICTEDRVYVAYNDMLYSLSADSGETLRERKLEPTPENPKPHWGALRVWGDVLVATASPVKIASPKSDIAPKFPQKPFIPPGYVPLIPPHDEWYYQVGGEPEPEWVIDEKVGDEWKTGQAGFGYGDDDDNTLLELENEHTAVYIRTTFTKKDVANATDFSMIINFDDAFIAYLNGREILRVGVRGGRGAKVALVDGHEAQGYQTFTLKNFQNQVRDGINVLAIEGHNVSLDSSDFSLDPYFVMKGPGVVAAKEYKPKEEVPEAFELAPFGSASRKLVAFDRHNGQELWSRKATLKFRHNCIAIDSGTLYCIDGLTPQEYRTLQNRGIAPAESAKLLALNLQTGEELWSNRIAIGGTSLSYPHAHDIVIAFGGTTKSSFADELDKGLNAYRGTTGELLWSQPEIRFREPYFLQNDQLVTSGTPGYRIDLSTGKVNDLKYHQVGGTASSFIMSSSNANRPTTPIAAGGVVYAPQQQGARSYLNQTALALSHDPAAEQWTTTPPEAEPWENNRYGLNLGAPGDRCDEAGTFWLEYPIVGGPSPRIELQIQPEQTEWYQQHTSLVAGKSRPWVGASGVKGITSLEWQLPKAIEKGTVRLYFCEPENIHNRERVFAVRCQGKELLSEVDVIKLAGARNRVVVQEFEGVEVGTKLSLQLIPKPGGFPPILSGVEVVTDW